MSSSKSNASAKQRRSEPNNQLNNIQQQHQQRPPQHPPKYIQQHYNVKHPQPPAQHNPLSQKNNDPVVKNKISVSDAIGLLSLRVGHIETQLLNTNNKDSSDLETDKSVLATIVSRIEQLESKNNNNVNIPTKKTNDNTITIEDLNELKVSLFSQISKIEKLQKDYFELKTQLSNVQNDRTNTVVEIDNTNYTPIVSNTQTTEQIVIDNNET